MNNEKKKDPFNLRRFLFKALTWMGIGAFIGMITAGSGGMIPDSWIPFTIFGFIALTFLWAIVFTRGLITKMTANGENIGGGNARRVPARVEKLEEAGLVVNNFNHLCVLSILLQQCKGSKPRHEYPQVCLHVPVLWSLLLHFLWLHQILLNLLQNQLQ